MRGSRTISLLPSLRVAVLCVACLANCALGSTDPFSSSLAKLDHYACVSLFYRNGRLGCGTADRSLQVGKLEYFEDGKLPEAAEPFVAVVLDYLLTSANLQILQASRESNGQLQGIIVLNSTQILASNSEVESKMTSLDAQTPQGYNTPSAPLTYGDNTYGWNAMGQDLFQQDLYGVPMVYVPDADVGLTLLEEAQASYGANSAVVAEFNYYMGPDGMKSEECLAWRDLDDEWSPKCMPLGGTSVWAVAGSPPPAENNQRPVVMVATNLDSTSMFHDSVPAANTAASNILATIMAAKLIGANLKDDDLDALPNRIAFGFFQGESYGFVGSRRFLKDVNNFQCSHTPVKTVFRDDTNEDFACLSPLRPSLKFAGISNVAGMITVDQVGYSLGSGLLYVHADENNDNYGAFLANVMKSSSTSTTKVASSSVGDGGNGYPYPPTPLTSLLSLSQGAYTGAVLTGYDYFFSQQQPYNSILDNAKSQAPNLDAIASAATILARTVLAAAYDDGSMDSGTYSANALAIIADELSSSDETLVKLTDCLFYSGNCDLFRKYAAQELDNERSRTGLDLRGSNSGEDPPNYYTSIFNTDSGQPFVRVGNQIYGAYDGNDYGEKQTDAFGVVPRAQERAIRGLLNDFLGRGTADGGPKVCKSLSDCKDVQYCSTNNDRPTCTAGRACVCVRAHYHLALDEGLRAADNEYPGFFVVDENDGGTTPMYTEPFWSPSVGVKVYRKVGPVPGLIALGVGLVMAAVSMFGAFVLKVGLKKEKLY